MGAVRDGDRPTVGRPRGLRGRVPALIGARQDCSDSVRRGAVDDTAIVRCNDDAIRAACERAFGNAHDHRLSRDVGQRLAGQARRRPTCRNEDREYRRPRPGGAHFGNSSHSSGVSLRASSSSITGMPSRIG